MAKRKKLTNREKALRAEAKKRLQAEGIIPPDKPRLNRKKYVEGALKEWNGRDRDCLVWDIYINEAISIMIGAVDRNLRVSPEAVGVAKALKLAVRLKEFSDMLKAGGRATYTVKEQLDYIRDILEA